MVSSARNQSIVSTGMKPITRRKFLNRSMAAGLALGMPRIVIGAQGSSRGSSPNDTRSEEHTSELQSRLHLVCRLLLEKKKKTRKLETRLQIICRLLLKKVRLKREYSITWL